MKIDQKLTYLYSISLYLVIVVSETLSYFNVLNFEYLRFFAIIFLIIFLIFTIINCKHFFSYFIETIKLNRIWLIILIYFLLIFINGFFIAPNLWDSMTYHFPRFFHWDQQGSLDFFITNNSRQNIMPILPDLISMFIYSVFLNDRFLFIGNYIQLLLIVIMILKMTEKFVLKQNLHYSILFIISIPIIIGSASSTQTDLLSIFLFLSYFKHVFFDLNLTSNNRVFYTFILLSLAISAKTTALIAIIPIFLFDVKRNYKKFINAKSMFFILLFIPSMLHFFRLYKYNKINPIGTYSIFNSEYTLYNLLSNFLKIIFTIIQTPVDKLNLNLENIYKHLNFFDKGGNYVYFMSSNLHPDQSGFPIHFVISIFLFFLIFSRYKNFLINNIIFISSLLLLIFILEWQPWFNRFSVIPFVIFSPMFAVFMQSIKPLLRSAIVFLLIFLSSFWLFFNPSRVMIDPYLIKKLGFYIGINSSKLEKINWDLADKRENQYFSTNRLVMNDYLLAMDYLNSKSITTLFIDIRGDDYEYPLWALRNSNYKIKYFPKNDNYLESNLFNDSNIYLLSRSENNNLFIDVRIGNFYVYRLK